MVHWADVVAGELQERHGDSKQVFATAITPSGPIHVGNMREVLTTEAIFRATSEAGGDCELLYIADDYDPLRKVYPFLKEEEYAQHVGKPLKEIPCPCGDHEDYAQHFLEPFLRNLEALGIKPTVLSAYELYHEGRYVDATLTSFSQSQEIRSIIEEVAKRQLPKRWAPFNPQCSTCRRITGVDVLDYVEPIMHCKCNACADGSDDPAAGTFELDASKPGVGKLPWRLDWPARWQFLGVTFEAFGKDHGASGGSWDSGIRLVRDIYGAKEPHHVMYEFLNLKGKGAMHSSTGLAVSAEQVLRMTPPEVLRYLLVRQSPRKHIDFDPGLGVLQLVDDFDKHERIFFGAEENPGDVTEVERTYQLSCPAGPADALVAQVPYRHLVTIAQIARSVEDAEAVLRRAGEIDALDDAARAHLADRIDHVRYWLDNFAPQNVRFQVQDVLPVEMTLSSDECTWLTDVATRLDETEWNGKDIHDSLYATVEAFGLKPPQVFRTVYQAILGQDRGPRAGFFLASLEKAWVVARLKEAALNTS